MHFSPAHDVTLIMDESGFHWTSLNSNQNGKGLNRTTQRGTSNSQFLSHFKDLVCVASIKSEGRQIYVHSIPSDKEEQHCDN